MKYEEYRLKVRELEQEYQIKKIELQREYIRANNPYKAGDKVTDHIGSIIIEKIGYALTSTGEPCATYTGIELKKDGQPKKNGDRRTVWQSNLV